MWFIFLALYLVSPIPLLVFALYEWSRAKSLSNELEQLKLKKIKIVEQPDIPEDVPVVAVSGEKKVPDAAQESIFPQAKEDAAPAAPKPVVTMPAQTSERPAVTIPVQASERPAVTMPVQASPKPAVSKPVIEDSNETNTVSILVIGVLLLLLASVGFISATWSNLSITARACCLLSFSFILLAAGIFARLKLNLENTSIAFYSVGSAALPITIIGSAAFGMFGTAFSLEKPYVYNTILLALSCLLVLLCFGSVFFQSRVFAAGTLISASLIVFTLAFRIESEYRLNVLIIALFASAAVLLIPRVKEIPYTSLFSPYAEVFEIYSVINLYVMSLAAIGLAGKSPYAGLFLILLSFSFLASSIRSKKNGLAGVPSVILFLLGTYLLFSPDGLLSLIFWLMTAAVCLTALSYLLKDFLSGVFFYTGLAFLILALGPITYYVLCANSSEPLSLLLTLPAVGGFLFLMKNKKQVLYSVGAIPALCTLLFGGALHIVSQSVSASPRLFTDDIFPTLPRDVVGLTAVILSAVLYLLFCSIPHHPFYTVSGNLILLAFACVSAAAYTDTFTDSSELFTAKNVTAFVFLLLMLLNAHRKDLLNVRDRSVKTVPRSIFGFRCCAGAVWPFFYLMGFYGWGYPSAEAIEISLTVLILIAFAYMMLHLTKSELEIIKMKVNDTVLSLPRVVAFCAAGITLVVGLCMHCHYAPRLIGGNPGMFVLTHMRPLLIPFLLFFIWYRFRKDAPEGILFGFFFAGLTMLTLDICYLTEIFTEFDVPEKTGLAPFWFSAPFLLGMAVLIAALFCLLKKTLDSVPLKACFVWSSAVCLILFFYRFADTDLQNNLFFSLCIAITFLVLALHIWYRFRQPAVSLLACLLFAIQCIAMIHSQVMAYECPVWMSVVFGQIPVVLLFGGYFLWKLVPDSHSDNREKNPFPSYMLLTQAVVFFATPIITVYRSQELALPRLLGQNLLAGMFRAILTEFATNPYLVMALPGFVLVGICWMLYRDDSSSRRRALALLGVLCSLLLVFRFPLVYAVAEYVGQLYLVPPALFVAFLPWILPDSYYEKNNLPDIEGIQFGFSVVCMFLLGITALESDAMIDLLFYGITAFLMLLGGYIFQRKTYLNLGIICMISILCYLIHRIWGDMAWWIYVFITGAVLITIAVKKELDKRFR